MGFRPQVAFACIDMCPADIMLTEFAKTTHHLMNWSNSGLYFKVRFWLLWLTLPASRATTSICLHCLGRGRVLVKLQTGDPMHQRPPGTHRQMKFQSNNGQFHDIPRLTKDSAWPVPQFHPRFCDHRNHRALMKDTHQYSSEIWDADQLIYLSRLIDNNYPIERYGYKYLYLSTISKQTIFKHTFLCL